MSAEAQGGFSAESAEQQSQLAEVGQELPEPGLASVVHEASALSLETDSDEYSNTISDVDSAIGSWRSSRTQSLTSSVVEYQYENGRRFHSYREGSYHLPNDENEQDRLDLQHHLYRIALDGKLFLAPLEKERIHDVLDVGCGTGIWCIDVADENPQAQVLGFDLSPIQPDMVPPNCKFLVDDLHSPWVFAERFDLIHTRALTAGIKDWPGYIQQAYEHLKPGGYIEMQEFYLPIHCTEDSASPKPFFVQWSEQLIEAGSKISIDFTVPKKFGEMLQQAGYEDINVNFQKWPIGPWAKGAKNKEIGHWWAEDLKEAIRTSSPMFTRVLGWSVEEVEVFAAKTINEIRECKKHMWADVCFAYARKPTLE